jgi:hypothetical protein
MIWTWVGVRGGMMEVIQADEDVCGMEDRVLVLLGVDVCLFNRFYIHILYNLLSVPVTPAITCISAVNILWRSENLFNR